MTKQQINLSIALFSCTVLAMFIFAQLYAPVKPVARSAVDTDGTYLNSYADIEMLYLEHTYINGTHRLHGEIPLVSACDIPTVDIAIAESMPEQVLLDFTIKKSRLDCQNEILKHAFSISLAASEQAAFSGRLQGELIAIELTDFIPQNNMIKLYNQ